MIKAIIFDCDGVVIDSEKAWDQSQEIFLERRKLKYNREKIKPLITGQSMINGVKIMKQFYGFTGDNKKLAEERTQIIQELMSNSVGFIPGFLEFYQEIKNKYLTCIATALHRSMLDNVAKNLRLNELFNNNLFSIDDVGGKSKPDPAIFLYAAKQLKVKPNECVVIEDSPNGIMAAKNANIYCIGITTTYPAHLLKQADQIVNSFEEIKIPE